ncbi:T9SS type B sorting domain-containing protein [uncultured Algibacter sp.]|uniref:T9SS type B sorting domain-containing protein n=1 Tax=uncultured Algibacter sp. TaxID=298659 RepID=UPI002627C9E0|nr:T9SS type B sorting domain-containing protein [uncultured Algibacter sp.]
MNVHKITLVTIVFLFWFQIIWTQSGSAKLCANAEPLCSSSEFSYPNTSGLNGGELGPNYGCLGGVLNPSWFYFQIEQPGSMTLQIEQSRTLGGGANLDVDYILYGPFTNPVSPCVSNLTAANNVDCSYANDVVEFANIASTNAGDYFLLLITNISTETGFITVTQIAGAATINCKLLDAPIVSSKVACQGDVLNLDATTANAVNYVWYQDDGSGTNTDELIVGANGASLNVTDTNVYKAKAFDANNVFLESYEFNIEFYETPNIPISISPYAVCDNFGDNDGICEFNFNSKDVEILNGRNPSDFLVTYYNEASKAIHGNLTESISSTYINSLPKEQIWVRVENILTNDMICYDVGSFIIQGNLLPEANLESDYLLCLNTNGTEEVVTPPIIDTGLDVANFSFIWRLNGTILPLETSSTLVPVSGGDYSVEVTNRITTCTNIFNRTVYTSEPPMVNAEVVSYAFIEDNVVEVTATGLGPQVYTYRIDEEPWQMDNIFRNVPLGEHTITVKDLEGCGQTEKTIMVMDYPKYFTPNGDGDNETWNIAGISNQMQARILIFDRYGKLLKQLSPNGKGWDGTFNGVLMPTSDYWFNLVYTEPKDGSLRTFKAHFTLKR